MSAPKPIKSEPSEIEVSPPPSAAPSSIPSAPPGPTVPPRVSSVPPAQGGGPTAAPRKERGPSEGPKDGHLVRFGPGPETPESLAADAAKAESAGFPHGVSTRLKPRISGTDKEHRSAPVCEVKECFDVKQTGKDPRHHTVVLPKPVTQEIADLFNALFTRKKGD